MIYQRATIEHKELALFSVAEHKRSEPLRECVKDALRGYFGRLDGHDINGLYQMVMSEVEGPLLQTVLEHTGGNQSQAAIILGISRGTLRKKLALHGIE
jgi:Fis family transcriptional regulator